MDAHKIVLKKIKKKLKNYLIFKIKIINKYLKLTKIFSRKF